MVHANCKWIPGAIATTLMLCIAAACKKQRHRQNIDPVAATRCHGSAYKGKGEDSSRRGQSTKAYHLANACNTQDPAILDWSGSPMPKPLKTSHKEDALAGDNHQNRRERALAHIALSCIEELLHHGAYSLHDLLCHKQQDQPGTSKNDPKTIHIGINDQSVEMLKDGKLWGDAIEDIRDLIYAPGTFDGFTTDNPYLRDEMGCLVSYGDPKTNPVRILIEVLLSSMLVWIHGGIETALATDLQRKIYWDNHAKRKYPNAKRTRHTLVMPMSEHKHSYQWYFRNSSKALEDIPIRRCKLPVLWQRGDNFGYYPLQVPSDPSACKYLWANRPDVWVCHTKKTSKANGLPVPTRVCDKQDDDLQRFDLNQGDNLKNFLLPFVQHLLKKYAMQNNAQ